MKFETERAKDVYEELIEAMDVSDATALIEMSSSSDVLSFMAEIAKAHIMAAEVALNLDVQLMAVEQAKAMADLAKETMAEAHKEIGLSSAVSSMQRAMDDLDE